MKNQIQFVDSSQRFNMGGPWIGSLRINGSQLFDEFLDDHFVVSKDAALYAFVRFTNGEGGTFLFGLIKTPNNIREFKILVFDSKNDDWLLSRNSWDALFLTKITEHEVFYVEAFHNESPLEFPEKRVSIDMSNFERKRKDEIIETIKDSQ